MGDLEMQFVVWNVVQKADGLYLTYTVWPT